MFQVSRTWEESVVEDLVDFLEEPRTGFDKADISSHVMQYHQEAHKEAPVSAGGAFEECSQMQRRLLTVESCGPYPTPHQMALQVWQGL